MQNNSDLFNKLLSEVLSLGANNVAIINANDIQTDAMFREMCKSNLCGMYGKCWMCPPEVGEISELMKQIRNYRYALVFNQISMIEDSFDIEGMLRARKRQRPFLEKVRALFCKANIEKNLILGVGGCGFCDECARIANRPCQHPEHAISSLEAYGINVMSLAETAGMKYSNGENTITYFGIVLF